MKEIKIKMNKKIYNIGYLILYKNDIMLRNIGITAKIILI